MIESMVSSLKAICDLVSQDTITARAVAAALGEVSGGEQVGVPFTVRPKDPIMSAIRVVRDGDSDMLSHVDLTPIQPIPMTALVATFGAPHEVPRATNPKRLPRVSFSVIQPGRSHTATIFASYEEGEHEAADGLVMQLMIRRD